MPKRVIQFRFLMWSGGVLGRPFANSVKESANIESMRVYPTRPVLISVFATTTMLSLPGHRRTG